MADACSDVGSNDASVVMKSALPHRSRLECMCNDEDYPPNATKASKKRLNSNIKRSTMTRTCESPSLLPGFRLRKDLPSSTPCSSSTPYRPRRYTLEQQSLSFPPTPCMPLYHRCKASCHVLHSERIVLFSFILRTSSFATVEVVLPSSSICTTSKSSPLHVPHSPPSA